jgi:uncharacterized protein (DUF302 family)
MRRRIAMLIPAAAVSAAFLASSAHALDDGIVRVKSAYPIEETVARLKRDVEAKGIRFFLEVDQHKLAAEAGVKTLPSTLLLFGNPALGTQFLNASAQAGIDWPVRMLVQQDESGNVWAVYTDFGWIAQRHGIKGDAAKPFETATGVIASIASSIKPR